MMPARTRSRATSLRVALSAAIASVALTACVAAGEGPGASRTVASIPGYQAGQATAPVTLGYEDPSKTGTVVQVELGQTSTTQMFIEMSQSFAPSGTVSFLVTNTGTETHEFVVLATETMAADFPTPGFEGEADRMDEEAKGVLNVGETGDMEPGTSTMLTLELPEGHYAVLCNLPGHYTAGMHQDLWVTPLA
jgi:uncharacterized cupredoxin-like copper-binding protein